MREALRTDIDHIVLNPPDCALVMIDGVPHLRLGQNCPLLSQLNFGAQASLAHAHLDPVTSALVYSGHSIALTRTEYRLMELLCEAKGHLRTYEELVKALWVDRSVAAGRVSLRSIVSAIRIKLRAGSLPDQLLVNIRGKGLRLDPRAA